MTMASTQFSSRKDLATALGRSIHDHWGLFLAEGIILVLLGLAAVAVPPIAGLTVTIFVGWVLLIGGIAGMISTFWGRQVPGFIWSLLSALVAIAAGTVLLLWPIQGLVTLTYVLIAYFVVDGLLTIVLAVEYRRRLSGRWEWLVLSGIIDLVLAGIIIAGLPGAFAWALGLLVGVDLVVGGASLIAMALAARTQPL
jgi:uncharacterized membrane protein HdeD (DUF308 family)